MSLNKNYTNTAFAITFTGQSLKIAFASPLNEIIYINKSLFYIALCPSNSNWVDLGEFSQGIVTVDYALCTAPIAGTRDLWIAAVLALISTPFVGPTSLAASSATDLWVGFNNTTKQFTDEGDRTRWCIRVSKSSAQALTTAAGYQAILFNVIVEDPLSQYNAATGIATITNACRYIIGSDCVTNTGTNFIEVAVDTGSGFVRVGAGAGGNNLANVVASLFLPAGARVRIGLQPAFNTTMLIITGSNNFWIRPSF